MTCRAIPGGPQLLPRSGIIRGKGVVFRREMMHGQRSKLSESESRDEERCKHLLGGGVVAARAWFDVADVDFFEVDAGGVVYEGGAGGFEELLVVAFGEVGFVVGSARFVAEGCALDYYAGELEHVVELAGEGEAGVGPLALVGEVDVFVAAIS